MRYVAIALGVVGVLVLVVVVIGLLLPVKHHAVRERAFRATPAQLFGLIRAVEAFPTWRRSVKSVELLPSPDGRPRFREVGSDGSIPYVIEAEERDQRLATRIIDPKLPFGGGWTFDIVPTGISGVTTLRITEDGEVYNPVFRFVSRFVLGHTATIDRYLGDVATRLPSA